MLARYGRRAPREAQPWASGPSLGTDAAVLPPRPCDARVARCTTKNVMHKRASQQRNQSIAAARNTCTAANVALLNPENIFFVEREAVVFGQFLSGTALPRGDSFDD